MKTQPPSIILSKPLVITIVRHTGKKIGLNYTESEALWVWQEWPDDWKRKVLVAYLWDKVKELLMLIVKIKLG